MVSIKLKNHNHCTGCDYGYAEAHLAYVYSSISPIFIKPRKTGQGGNYLLHKSKMPYIKDVFLAYLIDGAKRTEIEEFPIIEKWMVATIPSNTNPYHTKGNRKECFYCISGGEKDER